VIGLPREVKSAGREILRLLHLYKKTAGGRLEINQFYPNPLSEDKEDREIVLEAHEKGIKRFERYWNQNTSVVYCGLVFSRGSKSFVFDNIDAQLIPQLEFKMTAAIEECLGDEKKVLGIISGLDFREKPYGKDEEGKAQSIPAWALLSKLEKQFKVLFLEKPRTEITSCDVLLVLQPRGLQDEDFKAIDQHVLQGKGAFFCETPFSFQELILLSQKQQVLNHQLGKYLQEEAQEKFDQATKAFTEATRKAGPQVETLWKQIQKAQKENNQALMQQVSREFQMQLYQNKELMEAFQSFQQQQQEAASLSRGMVQPRFDGEAAKLVKQMEAMVKKNFLKDAKSMKNCFDAGESTSWIVNSSSPRSPKKKNPLSLNSPLPLAGLKGIPIALPPTA
jgi:hypothetical protein